MQCTLLDLSEQPVRSFRSRGESVTRPVEPSHWGKPLAQLLKTPDQWSHPPPVDQRAIDDGRQRETLFRGTGV